MAAPTPQIADTGLADDVAPVVEERPEASSFRFSRRLRIGERLVVVDAAMLGLAAFAQILTADSAGIPVQSVGWLIAFPVVTIALLALRGVYRAQIAQGLLESARTIIAAAAVAAMMVTFLRVLAADDPYAASQAVRQWVFASVYLMAGRGADKLAFRHLLAAGRAASPTLIIGAGTVGRLMAKRMLDRPEFGLRPVGFIDDDPLDEGPELDVPVLGGTEDLERVIREYDVEHAIFGFSRAPYEIELQRSQVLQQHHVAVSIVPRLFEKLPDRVALERLHGLPILSIYPTDPRGRAIRIKYALDPVIAALAILVVSPVMIVAALGTFLTLGRPILFRQPRVGRDSKEFELFKFRTMRGSPTEHGEADAAWAAAELGEEAENSPGAVAAEEDSEDRRTAFGSLLRRSGVDELPQLFNVLRREMSIVGPRPERPSYASLFRENVRNYGDRHRVKAGITGWAQVHGLRGNTSLADRVEWDNYYIENWSLWLDLKIALMTPAALWRTNERDL